MQPPAVADRTPSGLGASDSVGLAWLVTGRWTTLVAATGAIIAARSALDTDPPVFRVAAIFGVILFSNLWLWWRVRRGVDTNPSAAGALVGVDVALLTWLLLSSGGVMNPASVFYLVQIVLVALVLGRTWAWIIASLSVAGYATLFLAPAGQLHDAQVMHPEIALHMRGMWIAFALTALIIAVLVTRLATVVERRDRAIERMRDRHARAQRVAGLTTVVAGAAHELGTPLSTIAVAARELEHALQQRGAGAAISTDAALMEDARLIRAEIDRCRAILDQMGGRVTEPIGEAPVATTCAAVATRAIERFNDVDRRRVVVEAGGDERVVWPVGAIAQALGNLVRNGLQASAAAAGPVRIDAKALPGARVRLTVTDAGAGMRADELARVGEPFFTTKPAGSGMGLGVFVARSAVEQLGGELVLETRPEGGVAASITLPRDVVRSQA